MAGVNEGRAGTSGARSRRPRTPSLSRRPTQFLTQLPSTPGADAQPRVSSTAFSEDRIQRVAQYVHLLLCRNDIPAQLPPAVHVEATRKLFESGVSVVNIHSGQPDQQKVLDFYG